MFLKGVIAGLAGCMTQSKNIMQMIIETGFGRRIV